MESLLIRNCIFMKGEGLDLKMKIGMKIMHSSPTSAQGAPPEQHKLINK
jgi:hypothetical protein